MFAANRQALVMSLVVPVVIASILGWLNTTESEAEKGKHPIPVLVVDQDQSALSKAAIAALTPNETIRVQEATFEDAQRQVREGDVSAVAVIQKGFSDQAPGALTGGVKPVVTFLVDPSKPFDAPIAEGAFIQKVAGVVANQTFGGLGDIAGSPIQIDEKPGAAEDATWSRAAHNYAGFGLQGLLFFAIESAVALTRERRLGIWNRLRAAPVPPNMFVLSRGLSSTVLAFIIVLLMFGVGAILFHIRILGSLPGFFAIALSASMMAACFGLLVATLGKTETASRGISILLILVMLATGGAWFPIRQMPDWVQAAANFMPVRWAVEGFDAMTWRGLGLQSALTNAGILTAFAVVFATLAVLRFRSVKVD